MQEWTEIIQQAMDKHAPMREVKVKNKSPKIPWMTHELNQKKEDKNKLLELHYSCVPNIQGLKNPAGI